jgi:transposase
MPNPYGLDLRQRAVAAYEAGEGSYADIADRFSVAQRTLERWVARGRRTGSVAAFEKGGGWYSPIDLEVMHAVVQEKPDRTTEELTRAYNRRVPPARRVHRSSFLRALRRAGYVFKKNGRGLQSKIGPMSKPPARRSAPG